MKKKSDDPWALAKKKYRLNSDQLTKAKELGMNPKKFGKSAPNKSEPWKGPLGRMLSKKIQKKPLQGNLTYVGIYF
jgi:hypothetical protein